ncbi:hypothetical protein CXF70_16850 [Planomicrobium sp. MB-3u-38]|nr:hypothetical protein CXF70_16850 [Planomicrobium sp. MB-3u-38]
MIGVRVDLIGVRLEPFGVRLEPFGVRLEPFGVRVELVGLRVDKIRALTPNIFYSMQLDLLKSPPLVAIMLFSCNRNQ